MALLSLADRLAVLTLDVVRVDFWADVPDWAAYDLRPVVLADAAERSCRLTVDYMKKETKVISKSDGEWDTWSVT